MANKTEACIVNPNYPHLNADDLFRYVYHCGYYEAQNNINWSDLSLDILNMKYKNKNGEDLTPLNHAFKDKQFMDVKFMLENGALIDTNTWSIIGPLEKFDDASLRENGVSLSLIKAIYDHDLLKIQKEINQISYGEDLKFYFTLSAYLLISKDSKDSLGILAILQKDLVAVNIKEINFNVVKSICKIILDKSKKFNDKYNLITNELLQIKDTDLIIYFLLAYYLDSTEGMLGCLQKGKMSYKDFYIISKMYYLGKTAQDLIGTTIQLFDQTSNNLGLREFLLTFYVKLINNLHDRNAYQKETYYKIGKNLEFINYCEYILKTESDENKYFLAEKVDLLLINNGGNLGLSLDNMKKIVEDTNKTSNMNNMCRNKREEEIETLRKKQRQIDIETLRRN
jgi:hypothetical protein